MKIAFEEHGRFTKELSRKLVNPSFVVAENDPGKVRHSRLIKTWNCHKAEIMATVFYLFLCFFSSDVRFSFGWFFVSLFFEGGTQVITQYRHASD